jgi:hypothetical protein
MRLPVVLASRGIESISKRRQQVPSSQSEIDMESRSRKVQETEVHIPPSRYANMLILN